MHFPHLPAAGDSGTYIVEGGTDTVLRRLEPMLLLESLTSLLNSWNLLQGASLMFLHACGIK